ncbi:MAG: lytic transglycosylase domain-containing protein [Candidatus Acidiferrales bacterium]
MRNLFSATGFVVALVSAAGIFPAAASADYAVLRSGARLHITGYERDGERVRLTVDGGTVSVAVADLVAVEPEEHFAATPAAVIAPGPFGNLIHAAAEKHGVDESLIRWVIAVESNFNPRAVSRRRAQGLMQLLPATAAVYSVANIFDPAENIDAGTRYLKDLLARYRGDLRLALAAYNAGPEMVERYGGVPPFPETQKYVRVITGHMAAREQDLVAKN